VTSIVIAAINHKRIRSNCCGRKLEASLDIEDTKTSRPVSNELTQRPGEESNPTIYNARVQIQGGTRKTYQGTRPSSEGTQSSKEGDEESA
jgi:hypothetical protein